MYKSIMNKSKLRAQISGLEENWVLVRCLALQKFLTIYAVDLYIIWHFVFPNLITDEVFRSVFDVSGTRVCRI